MGLVNARNLRKAKELLDKNRHKVGEVVDKAAVQLDKVSGGKTANLSKKATEAARKYSAGDTTHHDTPVGPDDTDSADIESAEWPPPPKMPPPPDLSV